MDGEFGTSLSEEFPLTKHNFSDEAQLSYHPESNISDAKRSKTRFMRS